MTTRIAHFIDTDTFGGAEVIVLELCKAFGSSEVSPIILHFGNPELVERSRKTGIQNIQLPNYRSYRSIKTIPFFALQFAMFLAKNHIDLVHSHLFGPTTAAGLAASLCRIPHVGTLHDTYIVEQRPSRVRLLQLVSILGSKLICVSETMRNRYLALGRFSHSSLSVIRNGVPLPESAPNARQSVRTELGIEDDEILFICVARFEPLKRQSDLIDIFSTYLTVSNARARLVFVGDGPALSSSRRIAQQHGLANKALFLGARNDVTRLLQASDVFLLCSETEGLSKSILEAMSVGLPVVATDVGGNQELIEDEKSGFLVPLFNKDRFIERMVSLSMSKQKRDGMGMHGRNIAESRFSFSEMLQRYKELYEELI